MNIEEHESNYHQSVREPPTAKDILSPEKAQESEEEDEINSHPLKSKFMESFEDIEKATAKFKITQMLNFVKLILSDSSVRDPQEGFYLNIPEFTKIIQILSNLIKINEIDPLDVAEIFDMLKPIIIQDRNQASSDIRMKVKIILEQFVEHMIDVIEIGHNDILNDFYNILNSYTLDLKKQEISQILREVDYKDNQLDKISFKVHLQWFTTQILGQFFFLNDIEPCIPLLVRCLDDGNLGTEYPEENPLKSEVSNMFKLTFELFGYDKAKKFIEVLLLKDQKLYSIFFNWFYSQGFVDENARPQTTTADFYSKSPPKHNTKDQSEEEAQSEDDEAKEDSDDDFPLSDNYKVIESRPKTSMGLMINTEEKKDVNFDLSPSQTDANEKHCKIFNYYSF